MRSGTFCCLTMMDLEGCRFTLDIRAKRIRSSLFHWSKRPHLRIASSRLCDSNDWHIPRLPQIRLISSLWRAFFSIWRSSVPPTGDDSESAQTFKRGFIFPGDLFAPLRKVKRQEKHVNPGQHGPHYSQDERHILRERVGLHPP